MYIGYTFQINNFVHIVLHFSLKLFNGYFTDSGDLFLNGRLEADKWRTSKGNFVTPSLAMWDSLNWNPDEPFLAMKDRKAFMLGGDPIDHMHAFICERV